MPLLLPYRPPKNRMFFHGPLLRARSSLALKEVEAVLPLEISRPPWPAPSHTPSGGGGVPRICGDPLAV